MFSAWFCGAVQSLASDYARAVERGECSVVEAFAASEFCAALAESLEGPAECASPVEALRNSAAMLSEVCAAVSAEDSQPEEPRRPSLLGAEAACALRAAIACLYDDEAPF